MKKITIISFLLLSTVVFSQTTYVPDDNFEQALIDLGYDDVLDDYVLTANISGVTGLSMDNRNISNLIGIEDFMALTYLYCSNNQLDVLDVSNNDALTYLGCNSNQIITLDISQNTVLTYLSCNYNLLANLDVSQNTALDRLACGSNQLTNIDISQNTALTDFTCFGNQLTNIDISQNTALTDLFCSSNQLTILDVSQNTALVRLWCSFNSLTNIDVSQNTALTNLSCRDNQFAILDLSQNTALARLSCGSNQLTNLNLSQNTALIWLFCNNNQLTNLDVRNGNNTNMEFFEATDNPNLTCIFVDDAAWSTANWTNIDAASTFVETQAECDALGVDEVYLLEDLQVYPNPITNQLFIINSNNLNIQSIQFYDILGNLVIKEHNNLQQIDVSSLKSGVYIVKIETDRGVISKKVVKE